MHVPEGWHINTVSDLFDVQLGKMLNKDAKKKHPQVPYLTNFNVRWGAFDLGQLNTMYFSERDKEKFSLKYGDLVMCEGGEVGRCAIWEDQIQPCFYQKALHRLRPKKEILPDYFQSYMSYIAGTKLLDDWTSKTSIAHLTKEKLVELPVRVPPLPEQQKIAQILSTWDKAIEKLHSLITAKQKRKKALMQQLLTGKKRFAGFEGEWKLVKLSSLCEVRRGASPRPIHDTQWFSDSGRGWVRIADVTSSRTPRLEHTTQYLSDKGVKNSVCVNPGDLIMSICGTIGVPKFLGIPACIHDGFVVFRNCSNNLVLKFLFYYLGYITEKLSSRGQPGTQKNLNTSIVGNIQLPLFCVGEQQKIASVLSAADKEIETHQKQLSALKQQKKGLMQQLLTGKKRVKIDEPVQMAAAGA